QHAHRQQLLLLDHIAHRAREEIDAPARPRVHDDLQRPGGLELRRGYSRSQHRRRAQRGRCKAPYLHEPSFCFTMQPGSITFMRTALNRLKSGTASSSAAMASSTLGIGRKRIARSPCDIMSDW